MKPIIINPPALSKINWLALVNMVALAGFIPQAYLVHVLRQSCSSRL